MAKQANEQDPHEESLRVVWHEPTQFNPLRHGPPYLPGLPYEPVKLSSTDRVKIKAFAKKAAVPPPVDSFNGTILSKLLALLQATSLLHQTSHWSTTGPSYYADHLLFERLYNESQEPIDQLAERSVGLHTPPSILPVLQAKQMVSWLSQFTSQKEAEQLSLVQTSLLAETTCLKAIDAVITELKRDQKLSHGLSNLLEGIADIHETFVYLLQQRSVIAEVPSYDYRM